MDSSDTPGGEESMHKASRDPLDQPVTRRDWDIEDRVVRRHCKLLWTFVQCAAMLSVVAVMAWTVYRGPVCPPPPPKLECPNDAVAAAISRALRQDNFYPSQITVSKLTLDMRHLGTPQHYAKSIEVQIDVTPFVLLGGAADALGAATKPPETFAFEKIPTDEVGATYDRLPNGRWQRRLQETNGHAEPIVAHQ